MTRFDAKKHVGEGGFCISLCTCTKDFASGQNYFLCTDPYTLGYKKRRECSLVEFYTLLVHLHSPTIITVSPYVLKYYKCDVVVKTLQVLSVNQYTGIRSDGDYGYTCNAVHFL